SQLTVGTLDANGNVANSAGSVQYNVMPGNAGTPDVGFAVSLTDVRLQSDLSDYTGELEAESGVRLTDRPNGPGEHQPATRAGLRCGAPVPCTATADAGIGSTCSIATSFNAILPGSAPGGTRAIWQLDQVEVFDSGPDGAASTAADNMLFVDQGIFIP